MKIVTDLFEWRKLRDTLQSPTLGFVPTMGSLHEGHLSLCRRCKSENEITIVSIFVNPTQFDRLDDFNHYPVALEQDIHLLKAEKMDFLLLPQSKAMYLDNYEVRLTETNISSVLEGAHRPSHFDGMLTVVLKLLLLVRPASAYFGEKDYQQLLLIQKMVDALFIPIAIKPCATIREADGLACSSRNIKLTPQDRQRATIFYELLKSPLSDEAVKTQLVSLGFRVDYIAQAWNRRLGAVWLGNVRLIDNVEKKAVC